MFRRNALGFGGIILAALIASALFACRDDTRSRPAVVEGDDWRASAPVSRSESSPRPPADTWIVTLDEGYFGLDVVAPRTRGGYADPIWVMSHKHELTLAKTALMNRMGLGADALVHRYDTLSTVALEMSPEQAARLSNLPGVAHVVPNEIMTLDSDTSLPYIGLDVDDKGANADPEAGARTVVAVIDTAARYWLPEFGQCGRQGAPRVGEAGCRIARVSNHTDCEMLPRFAAGWACTPGGGEYDQVAEDTLHGSNVAGIVGKVAPGAGIWAMNVAHIGQLQRDPRQTRLWIFLTDIIDALNTINANPQGVVSVNMSLGSRRAENTTTYCAGGLGTAARSLWTQNGIVVAVSSGNDATKNAIGSPACEPYVVTVGAHYDTHGEGGGVRFSNCTDEVVNAGEVTCFSNSQASLDIVAPGGFVRAGDTSMSGTSQAAPHVAGFLALIQSQALRSPSGQKHEAPALVAILRTHARNQRELRAGTDGTDRAWTHRQLAAEPATDHDALHVLHGDPTGFFVPPGARRAIDFNLDAPQGQTGSPGPREIVDTWLDVEIEHADVSTVSIALVAPGEKRYAVVGEGGGNLHQLLGVQSEEAFTDAFDGEVVAGDWRLEIDNLSGTHTARLIRAAFLMKTRARVTPPRLTSFSFDEDLVEADGDQIQTFRVHIEDAREVGEVRLMINRPEHSDNGRGPDGHLLINEGACREMGATDGNAHIKLRGSLCQWRHSPGGAVEIVLPIVFEASFGSARDNQVSLMLLDGQSAPMTAWMKVTTPGEGFEVTSTAPEEAPASLRAFELGSQSVVANGAEVQTFRMTLDRGTQVDAVRFMVNHPNHTEGDLSPRGYFEVNQDGCAEVTERFGNEHVTLLEDECRAVIRQDGSVEFSVPFVVEPSFGVSFNNQVSAIWYKDGVPQPGWQRVTEPGHGFSAIVTHIEATFAFDQPRIVANGTQLQTFRLRLTQASQVNDVRFLVNHPVHVENGEAPGGYFQITAEGCRERTEQFGNPGVRLAERHCKRREVGNGVYEYIVRFAFDPGFGSSTNNQVSAIWFERGVPRSGWRRLTTPGEGFEIIGVDGPVRVDAFTLGQPLVRADGLEVQTLRLILADAVRVDEVQMMLNRPEHSDNGRGPDGHFQITTEGCAQLGGQGRVTLLQEACGRRARFDSSVEFTLSFVVEPGFGEASDNSVSANWSVGGTPATSWIEVSESGEGFDVVAD